MRLRRLKIEKTSAGGGLFDGIDVWFGRDTDSKTTESLVPLCMIGPNGSGKSQFLQLLAEIFQAAWYEHSPQEERTSANPDMLFELTYLIRPDGEGDPEEVTLARRMKGRNAAPIELFRKGEDKPIKVQTKEFGRYLPSIVVGYTSGDNETLSLPFLVSRSGYAEDVARAALKESVQNALPDNRLMLIDYGTNLEVLFANLMLGEKEAREEILRHARLYDLASCRCVVRLAHPAVPKAPAKRRKVTGRKGIQLTDELENIIRSHGNVLVGRQED